MVSIFVVGGLYLSYDPENNEHSMMTSIFACFGLGGICNQTVLPHASGELLQEDRSLMSARSRRPYIWNIFIVDRKAVAAVIGIVRL